MYQTPISGTKVRSRGLIYIPKWSPSLDTALPILTRARYSLQRVKRCDERGTVERHVRAKLRPRSAMKLARIDRAMPISTEDFEIFEHALSRKMNEICKCYHYFSQTEKRKSLTVCTYRYYNQYWPLTLSIAFFFLQARSDLPSFWAISIRFYLLFNSIPC